MASVNNPNPSIDLTVRVFDSFNQFEFNVPANEYDVVFSFFKTKMSTEEAARSFATTLFRISVNNNIPVVDLLDQIRNMNQMDLTVTMAYYLNGLRSPTTLLGVSQILLPNYYAARNVVQ
jgi:hypothetical protein